VKKHWYKVRFTVRVNLLFWANTPKDMHYAEFAEDEVCLFFCVTFQLLMLK
jgi:hypothetical protein